MIDKIPEFGYHILGETIGEAWLDLVRAVYFHGERCFDEDRERRAIQNLRFKSRTQETPDPIISEYGNVDNLQAMINLTFSDDVMYDFDVTPSFGRGPKSYRQRIKEGKMFDFVVERLSQIPESKKAVVVFPTNEDYEAVLRNMKDDYLPCLVSLQFRLSEQKGRYGLNTTFNFRSMDVFQKGHGNLEAIAMMTKLISERLGDSLGVNVNSGYLDGMIVDAHIYENTISDVEDMLSRK